MAAVPTFKEDLLQFIWEQQLFDRHALRTTDDEPMEVLRPGRVQHHSGPDVIDARIRIDGQVWAGNVEVHLRSSEWYAHGHQKDPAYDNVVLHVVWEHDMAVRTARGARVPTLELAQRVRSEHLVAYERLMRNKSWVACEEDIGSVDPARVDLWLERVLIERMERKTHEVATLFHQLGGDRAETFYHLLARAFGVKVNAEPFAMLAHALPLKVLLKYRDDALRTEALLFGQAGLLRVDLVDEHPRALQAEHTVLAHLHDLRPAPMAAWKFARLHPPNFPTIRIAQFAQVIMRTDGVFSEILECDDLRALERTLMVTAGPYWNDHYRFDERSAGGPKRLGAGAVGHLVVNAIVPFRFAMARHVGDEGAMQRALRLLDAVLPEANGIVDRWMALGMRAENAARSQALIELKNLYCSPRRCLLCGIGTELLKQGTR